MWGGIVGGLILFLWGMIAWTILPLHDANLKELPAEDQIIEFLRSNIDAKGVYTFPHKPSPPEPAEMDLWTEKYQAGPVGMIVYDPQGASPITPAQLITGLILNILAAFLASWFLGRSTAVAATFVARVSFCGMLGILISLFSHLQMWNWMNFSMEYTTAMVADTLIGWLLAGAGIAAVIKQPELKPLTAQ